MPEGRGLSFKLIEQMRFACSSCANPFTDESVVAMQKASRYSRAPNTIAVIALIGLVMMAYLRWARPYQLRWGATDAQAQRTMPGDELNPNPMFLATRAITIEAKPEDIWPWLVQMG